MIDQVGRRYNADKLVLSIDDRQGMKPTGRKRFGRITYRSTITYRNRVFSHYVTKAVSCVYECGRDGVIFIQQSCIDPQNIGGTDHSDKVFSVNDRKMMESSRRKYSSSFADRPTDVEHDRVSIDQLNDGRGKQRLN